jgi:hypothetical protein
MHQYREPEPSLILQRGCLPSRGTVHDITRESRDDICSACRVQRSTVRPQQFVFEVNSTHDTMVSLTF